MNVYAIYTQGSAGKAGGKGASGMVASSILQLLYMGYHMAARRYEISVRVLSYIVLYYINTNTKLFPFRCDLLCNNSYSDLFTCEDTMFSRGVYIIIGFIDPIHYFEDLFVLVVSVLSRCIDFFGDLFLFHSFN